MNYNKSIIKTLLIAFLCITSTFLFSLNNKMSIGEKDKKINESKDNEKDSRIAITFPSSSIKISGGSIILSESSNFDIGISNTNVGNGDINYKKVPKVKYDINWRSERVFYHWGSTVSTSNPKVNINVDSLKIKGFTLEDANLRFITNENDTILYKNTGKISTSMDGKETYLFLEKAEYIKYKDPCETKYKLKEITYSETTTSGIYGLKFSFQFENNSDLPENVAMIVEIKDCAGNSQFVKVTLKFDGKTNTYIGSVVLTESKGCTFQLVYGEIAAYNACKDKTVWSFDTEKSKSNGSGTRNVATANNGKPGLL